MKTIRGKLDSGQTAPSPKITCWLPELAANGMGVVIFPGGGYSGLSEHEGAGYARYFCEAGIACFVVEYRLGTQGHRHPSMLEDALAAVYTIRNQAAELGLDPQKIGVMGSSAGGHLSAHVLVAWDQYACDISLRPDFGILCYPVIISTGEHAHKGSMRNVAGENPPSELLASLSCERWISAQTPPCFLWHTGEDASVPPENSLVFASALRACGVSCELHLYQTGGHGLGLEAPFDWAGECLRWLGDLMRPGDEDTPHTKKSR